ncbi:MAG: TRAP transporter small permease subunit [Desulfovermiculus sp.]|nr:TRAP transporter small permease subunit [Desulfovermiculus sp.]
MLNTIDRMSTWAGKGVAWLVPILILELVYDAAARYLFNAPTKWSFDISYMLYAAIFLLAAAYTLQKDEHVRIELIYDKFPPRGRAFLDCFGYLVFFFPAMCALIYYGSLFAWESWMLRETSNLSMWQPPIYPLKTVLPLATVLLSLQGIAIFVRSLRTLIQGETT